MGKPFMPWQQSVADVICEIDPDTGRLVYQEYGLTVPRQSGKSTFVLAKVTHRCSATGFFGDRQRTVYTAQTRAKAREKWEEDFVADLEASVFKTRVSVHKGNGQEHIRFQNGSKFGIDASTEKAGHGGTLDEVYIDEAFAQIDFRLEQAFGPAMITRRNKQLGWISTAGWLGGSPYLAAKVKVGRAAVADGWDSGVAYFEWSADEGADPGDPVTWWSCMPALGHTITENAIRLEYEKALYADKLNDFKRAYLNLWVPKENVSDLIAADRWGDLVDRQSQPATGVVFGIDVTPDRAWSSLALSGRRADGLMHVDVDDVDGHRRGTDWVVDRCVELAKHYTGALFVIDGGGPGKSLVDELKQHVQLTVMTVGDAMAAAGLFVDAVSQGTLRHRGQLLLDAAVAGAKPRPIGDGGWAFGRKNSDGDISALNAASYAHWAAVGNGYDVLQSVW